MTEEAAIRRHPSAYVDRPRARDEDQLVAVSQWRNADTVVIGNGSDDEWLTGSSDLAVDLSAMR